MASDAPPAYSTIDASTTNLAAAEDGAPNCNDGTEVTEDLIKNSFEDKTTHIGFIQKAAEDGAPNCNDGTEDLIKNSFEDKTTRIGFIQKVLAIKLLQLFLFAVVCSIYQACSYDFMVRYQWSLNRGSNREHLIVLSILMYIGILWLLVKVCTARNRQQHEIRYLFLVGYPIVSSLMVTFLTIFWDFLGVVLVAWFTYCGAVFTLLMYSIFALHTKLEFTAMNVFVLAVITQIVLYAIIAPFAYVDALYTLYVTIALGVETAYVVWDLEIMTSKSYWTHITPGDYLDGALNLHIDYYYITSKFLYPKMLKSVKSNDDDNESEDVESGDVMRTS